jgi:hypothetical protein
MEDSMPVAFFTATCDHAFCSPPYFNDADGSGCLFIGPPPDFLVFTNLDSFTHRMFWSVQLGDCTFNFGAPSVLMAPGVPTQTNWPLFNRPNPATIALAAQDVGAGTFHLKVAWGDSTSGICNYGTRLKASGQLVYYLVPSLIDTWLVVVGMPWLAAIFTPLYFTVFHADTLCGSGPPPLPVIDLSTLQATLGTIQQILAAVAWPSLCECVPGTPSAVPPPLPSAPQPTGWPVTINFNVSNGDLAAGIIAVQQQILLLQQTLGADLGLATLLQRYGLPFAYVRGATHAGITGSGSFAVSRLLGLEFQVIAQPAGLKTVGGFETYIFDLGWISIESADGFIDEVRLTRTTQLWFSRLMPMALRVGHFFNPGVTVSITELQAEV